MLGGEDNGAVGWKKLIPKLRGGNISSGRSQAFGAEDRAYGTQGPFVVLQPDLCLFITSPEGGEERSAFLSGVGAAFGSQGCYGGPSLQAGSEIWVYSGYSGERYPLVIQ